ncbi:hypothetical protein NDU88_000983 [Pleurodeles waltl]|uniref:Uncharacterized protein n=1 Tax=Pleurodeles waltl TaxID=8319 RepID=A0AAV7WM89_PLEWA|nr:hypothetical protein NDU88_000983 [Pleurodeles waltl]
MPGNSFRCPDRPRDWLLEPANERKLVERVDPAEGSLVQLTPVIVVTGDQLKMLEAENAAIAAKLNDLESCSHRNNVRIVRVLEQEESQLPELRLGGATRAHINEGTPESHGGKAPQH